MDKICPRCNKVHNCPPVDINKIRDQQAQEIATTIDKEVLEILSARSKAMSLLRDEEQSGY